MLTKITLAAAALTIGFAAPSFAAPANGPFGHAQNAPRAPIAQPASYGQPAFGQPAFGKAAYGRPQQWRLVGQRLVGQRPTRDAIPVPGNARHQQIIVCAYNPPVRLSDLDVRFMNGGAQGVAVRNVLQPGTCTRAIDLKGQTRNIRSVNLAYNAMGFGYANALVKVFAR